MSYRVELEAGESWRKFPNGEFAFRASDFMGAARGTLTSGSGEGTSGTYVQDTQQVALSNWSSSVKWNNTNPYLDQTLVDPTLEIPLKHYPFKQNGADWIGNQKAYWLYASCRWPGLAAGDGYRDNTFLTHGSTVTIIYPYAVPAVSPPPYTAIQFLNSGSPVYYANQSHYTMHSLGRFVIWNDAAGDNYDEDGVLQIIMASRETECGTITPRIDQLVFVPFNYGGAFNDYPPTANDYRIEKYEGHVKVDDDLDGVWTTTENYANNTPDVIDYQEASNSDDAEFSAGVHDLGLGSDIGKFYKTWVVAGINNWDDTDEVVVDAFTNTGNATGPDPSGLGFPYPGHTSDNKYWWDRYNFGFENRARDTFVPCTYVIDGSVFTITQVSMYWSNVGFAEYANSDIWMWTGGSFVLQGGPGTDYGNGTTLEPSTTYNYNRNYKAYLGSNPDWQVSCKVSWDKVPRGLYRNGLILTDQLGDTGGGFNRPCPVANHLSWAAEMDENGDCWGRLRLEFVGSSSVYPPWPTPHTDNAIILDEYSTIMAEHAISYTPDLGSFLWLKMWRNGYRVRCKIWADGDTEPDWQVDEHLLRATYDIGSPTTRHFIDYPYIPPAGEISALPQMRIDFPLPGLYSWVDCWDADYWNDPGPNIPDSVGYPQPVTDPLTANFDDFQVDYHNPGDLVDCNIRFYGLVTEEPVGDTIELPKKGQYIVFVQDHNVEAYDDTNQTEGFPFKAKMWNDNGAPPLQGCIIKDPIANYILHKPIHLDIRFRPYEEPDV